MKTEKTLLLISIILILTLLFISPTQSLKFQGKVVAIKYREKTIEIKLDNHEENFTIIDDGTMAIREGNLILIEGKTDKYKNHNQIIIESISRITI